MAALGSLPQLLLAIPFQEPEQEQVILQGVRDQEILFDVLAARFFQLFSECRFENR